VSGVGSADAADRPGAESPGKGDDVTGVASDVDGATTGFRLPRACGEQYHRADRRAACQSYLPRIEGAIDQPAPLPEGEADAEDGGPDPGVGGRSVTLPRFVANVVAHTPATRRLPRSVTTLAAVRRSTRPVVQVNVAKQQINVAG
jgi:hypothetical protein